MRKSVRTCFPLGFYLPLGSLGVLDLVWESISANLKALSSIWWEHQDVIDKLNAFRRVNPIIYTYLQQTN